MKGANREKGVQREKEGKRWKKHSKSKTSLIGRTRERMLQKHGDDLRSNKRIHANADFYIENVNKLRKILIIDSEISS